MAASSRNHKLQNNHHSSWNFLSIGSIIKKICLEQQIKSSHFKYFIMCPFCHRSDFSVSIPVSKTTLLCFNPLNPELNPICYLLALLGAHHFLHVSRIRVKSLTVRLLMSYIYIYGAPILDVSRSHTTTQNSR